MSPEFAMCKQRGAGLPLALFIITVLSLIVLAMSQLQESGGQSVSLQIQSQRAFYAAESGAQIAVHNVLEGGSCDAMPTPIDFSAGALSSCQALLTCESVTVAIGSGGNTVYSISSTGRCGSGPDAASRVVEVRVR